MLHTLVDIEQSCNLEWFFCFLIFLKGDDVLVIYMFHRQLTLF